MLFLLSSQPAFGAAKVALVIGNATYPGHTLATPANDARLITQTLKRSGFRVTQRLNSDAKGLRAAIATFEKASRTATIAAVYFAGLAAQVDGTNYLLPVGAKLTSLSDIKKFGVAASRVVNSKGAAARFLILDPSAPPSRFRAAGLVAMRPATNQLITFGVQPGKWPKGVPGSNGFFARALAKTLSIPGIDPVRAFRMASELVSRDTKGRQKPWIANALRHAAAFTTPPPVQAQASRPAGNSVPHATAKPAPASPKSVQKKRASKEAKRRVQKLRQRKALAASKSMAKPKPAKKATTRPTKPTQKTRPSASGGKSLGYVDSKGKFHPNSSSSSVSAASRSAPSMSPEDIRKRAELRRRMEADRRRQIVARGRAQESAKKQSARNQNQQRAAAQQAQHRKAKQGRIASSQARAVTPPNPEMLFWKSISSSGRRSDYVAYLEQFPKGTFAPIARMKLKQASALAKHPTAIPASRGNPAPSAVNRYPTIESPDEVPVGQNFSVQVSLTIDEITPEVTVKPSKGTVITKEGALALPLPAGDEWEIDVVLSAPGFKLASGRNTQKIVLSRDDDSTPALFELAARPIKTGRKARKIYATLWHKGAYLAKVIKPIEIVNPASVGGQPSMGQTSDVARMQPAPSGPPRFSTAPANLENTTSKIQQAKPATFSPNAEPPQLTVYILHGAKGEDGPSGQIIINSPFLQPTAAPYTAPDDMTDWVTSQYDRLLAELSSGAALPLKERTVPMMRGFGQLIYKYFAPDAFKAAFWKLKDKLGPRFTSIQIYTNNPLLPWELMRPLSKDGRTQLDFIGLEFRIARWHIGENSTQLDKPPQRLLLQELVTIAPRYKGKDVLPNQVQEMSVLAKLPGHRALSGKLSSVRELLTNSPRGIIHFSGHGIVGGEKNPTYAIRLEDVELDVVSWRGMAPSVSKNHPFFFLNACDIGKAQRVANFVDGWAPAVLETGAGGYVGGLWPLTDTAAAGFSNAFYTRLYTKLRDGDVKAAEVLQFARRDFLKTGDPTYLAYAFYGDVNLRFATK